MCLTANNSVNWRIVLNNCNTTSSRAPIFLLFFLLQRGDAVTAKDEITCPEDWEWTTEWTVDLNRAVDEDGNT